MIRLWKLTKALLSHETPDLRSLVRKQVEKYKEKSSRKRNSGIRKVGASMPRSRFWVSKIRVIAERWINLLGRDQQECGKIYNSAFNGMHGTNVR